MDKPWICHIAYGRVLTCTKAHPHIFCAAIYNIPVGENITLAITTEEWADRANWPKAVPLSVDEELKVREPTSYGLWALIKRGWL